MVYSCNKTVISRNIRTVLLSSILGLQNNTLSCFLPVFKSTTMNETKQQKQKVDPLDKASWLSKIFFLYTIPVFRKGEISESDLYGIPKGYESTTLGDKLQIEWEKEMKANNPWLLRPLLKAYGLELLMLGLSALMAEAVLSTLKPVLIGKIVKIFDIKHKDLPFEYGAIYVSALVLYLFISGTMVQFYLFHMDRILLKIKISCSTLVYRKLVRSAASESFRGQAITLITKDINACNLLLFAVFNMTLGSVLIIVMSYMMYMQIGFSSLIGMSWLLVYFPLQGILWKYAAWFRLRASALTDKRFKKTQEVLTAAKIVKMYIRESFCIKAINRIRQKEMLNIRIFRCLEAVAFSFGSLSLKLILLIAVTTYVGFGNNLTAEKVYVVTSCLAGLYGMVELYTPLAIGQFGNFSAAMQRLSTFLASQEVIRATSTQCALNELPGILVKNLTVKLGNTDILHNITLSVEKGLTMLKGPIGAGKSTFFHALTGEVQISAEVFEVKGIISYASQEPWLFPGTVRQNILFGQHYDSRRYKAVIQVCGLKKDLQLFSNGDSTYLTDRGLNLSRGQKTRINLARCVYKDADIYLLDDSLAALDVQVSKNIFYHCIKEFLKDKICILATHNDTFVKDANQVVVLGEGRLIHQTPAVTEVGGDSSTKQSEECATITDSVFDLQCNHMADATDVTQLSITANNNKNIYEEFNEKGRVTKEVYQFYLSSGGGIWVFIGVLLFLTLAEGVASWSNYFLSAWIDSEQKLSNLRQSNGTNSTEYMAMDQYCSNMTLQYSGIFIMKGCFEILSIVAFVYFTYVASVKIHSNILQKIFKAPLQFFDKNLSGNILNKFSRDIGIIDEQLPTTLLRVLQIGLFTVAALGLVSSVRPFLLIPSGLLLAILYIARCCYLPTGRSIRRLEGSTRSPIIGHLNATVDGLTTVRANQMQSAVMEEFEKHQDLYFSVTYLNIIAERAFGLLLEMSCTFYIGFVNFAMLFFRKELFAGQAGLAITQSLSLSGVLLQYGVRQWAEIENHSTSAERVMTYTSIDSENESGEVPPTWPNKGKIVYNGINLRYPLTGDLVLKNINFVIDSKEKLGVVGRTGAGKSSLISVLCRLYHFSGSVTIDDISTSNIKLQYLRSKISVIHQDPYLFTGTIRDNLDPFKEFSDKQIWDALENVEMKRYIHELDLEIYEGGNNFSTGQKQLICLAEAILRKNIILVLDEATANLDSDTDVTIQRTIKSNFANCTVITIAHRINTILSSDKILVMDQGEVAEFGSPESLLKNSNGHFYKIVQNSGLLVNSARCGE